MANYQRPPVALLVERVGHDPRFVETVDREETVRLIEAARGGDEDATFALVASTARLGFLIAKRHRGLLEFEDAFQWAMFGACVAIRKFDPSQFGKIKFITYAMWWMRQCVSRARQDQGNLIRVPVHAHESNRRLIEFTQEFLYENGFTPTAEHIAEGLEVPLAKAVDMERTAIAFRTQSMFQSNAVHHWLLEPTPTKATDPVFENMQRAEAILSVRAALKKIPERNAFILVQRFGGQSLEDLGKQLNITRERVRQLEARGLQQFAHVMGKFGPIMTATEAMRDTN